MRIITVSAGYRETLSLPGYNNVQHSFSLSAEVEEGEDWEEVKKELRATAEIEVKNAIDNSLVENGKAPKYYNMNPYQVLRCRTRKVILVTSDYSNVPKDMEHPYIDGKDNRGLRKQQAREYAKELAGDAYRVVGCANEVPPLYRTVHSVPGFFGNSSKFAELSEAEKEFSKLQKDDRFNMFKVELWENDKVIKSFQTENYSEPEPPEEQEVPF